MFRLGVLLCLALAACRVEPDAPAPDADVPEAPVAAEAPEPPASVSPPDAARPTSGPPHPEAEPPPPAVAASGLAIPVAGVAAADLVDTFTDARSAGRSHDAIDILAPRGTPVVAAADGEVVRLFTSEKGGLTVYQRGPEADGRWPVYYYAHLDAYAPGLAEGQRLRRGDAVGTVGDTGNAVPGNTHLHFAIWTVADSADFWDGEAVNPYPLLAGR